MKRLIAFTWVMVGIAATLWAGNEKRAGQAGATELLINPWARSSGWHAADAVGVHGVEAMRFNPASILFVGKTEFAFSRTTWLQGADIYINSFGFVTRLGEDGDNAFGVSLMSFDFGDILITTAQQPEGGLGTYSPQFINLGMAYGHRFSSTISGGVLVRLISEALPDARAMGAALDAGVRYTSSNKRTRFGVSLRNVGTPMRFGGDGLAFRGTPEGSNYELTLQMRSGRFDLPSLLHITGSHDFLFGGSTHVLTVAANFTSHTYQRNELVGGLQYSFKDIVQVRGGFLYQRGILSDNPQTVYTGPAGGVTLNVPLGSDRAVSIDYSYRAASPWKAVHAWGVRLNL